MAYNRVGTPKFYIDAALLARQWGQIDTDNEEGKYHLNPSKVTQVAEGGVHLVFKTRHWLNSLEHAFILGHNFKTEGDEDSGIGIYFQVNISGATTTYGVVGSSTDLKTFDLNGWDKFDIASDIKGYDSKEILLYVSYVSDALDGVFTLGDISIGWTYEMQHSPDLELTLSYSNESIKTQTTLGGNTLTSAGWSHQPQWIRGAWSKGIDTNVYPSHYPGRRNWKLKFSYLSDNDTDNPLFPQYYNETDIGNTPNTNWGIFEKIGEDYHIKKDFISRLYAGTNSFQLPFIFQPDSNSEEYAICRVNRNTMSFKQVANNVYDISLDITETW